MAEVTVTPNMVEEAIRDTDWARIDALTDDEIAAMIAADPDVAPDLTDPRVRALLHMRSDKLPTRHKLRFLRRSLGLSQRAFAEAYAIPLRTLQNWEAGAREPDEAAKALLTLIAYDPERAREALSSTR
ncbi:MAG TPA: helix-turn-helix domain-containing protein [Microvirga sp.]|nr:helix-turn-helix domain-containing protein [Microvirga sp.]